MTTRFEHSARQLREAFDASFGEPISVERVAGDNLLAIRAGRQELALRSEQIAAIMRCPPLIPLPSRSSSLRGIARVRGAVVAVHSLAILMGEEGGELEGRWLVVCRADLSAGLLFDELAGYASVARSDIRREAVRGGAEGREPVEVVALGGVERRLVNVDTMLRIVRPSDKGTAFGEI